MHAFGGERKISKPAIAGKPPKSERTFEQQQQQQVAYLFSETDREGNFVVLEGTRRSRIEIPREDHDFQSNAGWRNNIGSISQVANEKSLARVLFSAPLSTCCHLNKRAPAKKEKKKKKNSTIALHVIIVVAIINSNDSLGFAMTENSLPARVKGEILFCFSGRRWQSSTCTPCNLDVTCCFAPANVVCKPHNIETRPFRQVVCRSLLAPGKELAKASSN